MDIAELGLSVRSDGVVVATNRLDDLEKSSKKAETATERLIKKTKRMSELTRTLGRNLSLYVTTPMLAVGAASVKFASDFESSFADVRKTVNATEDEFASMADEIRALAKTVPTSVEELNRLAGVAGQLGVQRENIVEFTRVIAMLGDTTDIAGEQAALSLSRFMNVMGTAQSDIDRVGSTIVGLGNNFAAMESEIVVTATSMAAFGSQMGLTEAQVLAFATAIAASGGQTEAASTAFQKTASSMQRAVIEINEDLQVFANVAGVSAEKFSRVFREDAAGAIQLFLRGLKNVSDQGLSTAAVLDLLGLADQRLQREFGKLLGDLDQLDNALVKSSDEWERNTALTEEAEKRYKTFASEMAILRNEIKDVAIELGTALLPHIRDLRDESDGLIGVLRGWVDAFAESDKETQKLILNVAAAAAALGPLTILLGTMLGAVSKLLPLLVRMRAFFAVSHPIVAMTAALGLFVYKIIEWADEAERLNGVLTLATTNADRFVKAIENAATASDLADEVKEIAQAYQEADDELRRINEALSIYEGTDSGSNPLFQKLIEDKEKAEKALIDLQEVYNNLRARQRELVTESEDLAEAQRLAAEAANAAASAADAEAAALAAAALAAAKSAEELERFNRRLQELKDYLDPAAASMRQLADDRAMLAKALEGGMPVEEYERFSALLKKLHPTFNKLTDTLGKFKKVNDGVAKKLKENFDFLVEADLQEQVDGMREMITALEGGAEAWYEYQKAAFQANEVAKLGPDATAEQIKAIQELAAELFDLIEAAGEMQGVSEDMATSFQQAGHAMVSIFDSLASAANSGSDAQRALALAAEATNTVLAIQAILNQGNGEVYTAWARMAMMAAAVAPLIATAINFAGSGGGSAQERTVQETQGTGSILGDAEAKSESILNATEITADATSELVGINRGMLNALRSLQVGITGASTQIIRGGEDGSEIPIPPTESAWFTKSKGIGDLLGINFIGDFISKLLGGKTKLLDTGLQIEGGAITDLINDVFVRAFADIKSKKWFGGSYKFSTIFEELDDEIGKQFALVFGSIVDTVTEAAKAIGIPIDDIEERIAAFQIATQKISLDGLTGEEQQEEILAVFSKIFDDLAVDVVPFIEDFQKVGEGLGETLVRVATSVQVMQEALKMLDMSMDDMDPEKFAEIAVGMVELAGGIDEFITKLQGFISKFAPEEWQDQVAIDAVTRGFEQIGLTLPDTRDGLWELVQGLDLTTESGRESLAAILDITDSLDTYYDILEEGEAERLRAAEEAARIREAAFNAEIQALLHIQSIAEGVSNSLKALRDRIIGETSTDEENYNRYKAEADALVADLSTMTDPDLIAETVAEIERLTSLAWGLLDESQKEKMGEDFLTFLEGVEAIALSRLGIAADQAVADTAFTPEEILARFNSEVTDPLILVAGAQGMAALKLDTAADKLLAATGADFSLMAGSDGGAVAVTATEAIPVSDQVNTSDAIREAVQAGMQAGAEAIVAAAKSMSDSGESTSNATVSSAQLMARAVASIPSRIVVQTTASEYS